MNDAPAFLCEVCHDQPWWRIERADAAVSWACSEHLSSVCLRLVRPGYNDRLSVMEAVPVVDASPATMPTIPRDIRRISEWLDAPIEGHGLYARYLEARELLGPLSVDTESQ